ncbi:class I SAM-dependent methyltransferase [Thermodesulfobacteriota bacterium]
MSGFVIETKKGFEVSPKATHSLLANQLLLDRIVQIADTAVGDMLDVGAGESPYFPVFRSKIKSYTRVDLSELKHAGKPSVCADAAHLPFQDKAFDTVLCTEVIEHCTCPSKVLREIYRVLKSSGCAIISAPFMYPYHDDPVDYYRFTDRGLSHLIENVGLKVVQIHPLGTRMDFGVDLYSKCMITILEKINFLKGTFINICVLFPQIVYLFFRRDRSRDEAFTLGHVIVAKKSAQTQQS